MNNSVTQFHIIWNLHGYTLQKDFKAAREQVIQQLESQNTLLCKTLLSGVVQKSTRNRKQSALKDTFSQQELRRLVDSIFSSGYEFDACNKQIMVLALVINSGNKLNLWRIPLPPMGVKPKVEKNPFTPQSMKDIKLARIWSSIFLSIFNQSGNLITRWKSRSIAAKLDCTWWFAS